MNYYLYKNYWRFAGAPHCEERISADKARDMLSDGGLLVRNVFDFDCQDDSGFWYVIKDSFGGLDELSSNTRRKIRKALDCLDYIIIDAESAKHEGYAIYSEALKAYPSDGSALSEKDFADTIEAHQSECWGCFDKATGSLVGVSINHLWDEACGYELMAMLPEYRHNATYAYYGLIYSMNEHYLASKGHRYVSDGSRSITEHSGVHDWLMKNFNFRKAYCHLDIFYKPWMGFAVKMLYPFRKITTLPRVKAVLNMEAMRRGEK